MNRMHLDLQIADATEAAQEIKRLRELGAPVLVDQHDDAGYSLRCSLIRRATSSA